MKVAYVRVSTEEQNEARQIEARHRKVVHRKNQRQEYGQAPAPSYARLCTGG